MNEKCEECLHKLRDTVKRNNICAMKISKGEENSIFKALMAENVLSLGKEMDIQIYNTQKATNRLNLNKIMSRYNIIKSSKVKD